MSILFALLSALFAGTGVILAKYGIRNTNAAVTTAMRTVVILGLAWGAVIADGSWRELIRVNEKTLLFLLLAGVTGYLSWFFYFRALESGKVHQVAAVDKGSTVLTMLGGWLFLGEPLGKSRLLAAGVIVLGILLMISEKSSSLDSSDYQKARSERRGGWLLQSLLSVTFVSLAALFAKLGIREIGGTLALAIRTGFVLIVAWAVVAGSEKIGTATAVDSKSVTFLLLSGGAAGLGWLCYYRALENGDAGLVQSIDKLSILVTVILSRILFGERISKRGLCGLSTVVIGIAILMISAMIDV